MSPLISCTGVVRCCWPAKLCRPCDLSHGADGDSPAEVAGRSLLRSSGVAAPGCCQLSRPSCAVDGFRPGRPRWRRERFLFRGLLCAEASCSSWMPPITPRAAVLSRGQSRRPKSADDPGRPWLHGGASWGITCREACVPDAEREGPSRPEPAAFQWRLASAQAGDGGSCAQQSDPRPQP